MPAAAVVAAAAAAFAAVSDGRTRLPLYRGLRRGGAAAAVVRPAAASRAGSDAPSPSAPPAPHSPSVHAPLEGSSEYYWVELTVATSDAGGKQTVRAMLDTTSAVTALATTQCVNHGNCDRADGFPAGYLNLSTVSADSRTDCTCGDNGAPCADSTAVPGTTDACLFESALWDGTELSGGVYANAMSLAGSTPVRMNYVALRSSEGSPAVNPKLQTGGRLGLMPTTPKICSPACVDSGSKLVGHGGFTLRLADSEMVLGPSDADAFHLPPVSTVFELVTGESLYTVCLGGIKVDNADVGAEVLTSWGALTYVDLSSPVIELARPVWETFKEVVQKSHCSKVPGLCGTRSILEGGWMWDDDFQKTAKAHLPDVKFLLDGVEATLTPEQYMLKKDNLRVLGIRPGRPLPWLMQKAEDLISLLGLQGEVAASAASGESRTVLGKPFLEAFDVHFNLTSGAVSLSGNGLAKNDAQTCTTTSDNIPSWWLPVGVAIAGVVVLGVVFVFSLAGSLVGVVATGFCLTAIFLGVAIFWEGPHESAAQAKHLVFFYGIFGMSCACLINAVLCCRWCCAKRKDPNAVALAGTGGPAQPQPGGAAPPADTGVDDFGASYGTIAPAPGGYE
eukprot:TRINITY_DN11193_c0_g2_i1.p1 TRINITY_DN11193_c0_g2~~TRINITY_DN11193_c0_g2_i1.p1  ORF type:complete len:647 (+),score=132.65 TRINITY_DN11193_c0_g2_i1:87-1943(+)